jgi:hypothetical protein
MLHDPSHVPVVPEEKEIILTQADKDILRRLGNTLKAYAEKDAASEKALLWTALNDLESKRPMVWMNEIPWHEMNVDDELTLVCTHPWAKNLERDLKREIYQRRHMPGDMIVSNYIECPKVFSTTDFGILEQTETAHTDAENEIYSRHFKIQISEEEDIEKIKMPEIRYMKKATEYNYNAMCDLFEGIIDVKLTGQKHIWYTPWDFLIRWWGIEEAMMDLVVRPQMVHRAYERMVDAWMVELDQFDELNLLSLDCNNTRIGSGGYGYTKELPGDPFSEKHVHPHNMWGCANAQILASVSPKMHWEFALEHDMRWLSRFGLTYYGCCEPLDNKIDLMKKISNLRKISVSPWCDTQKIAEQVGGDYVMSRKPNPAIFAETVLDEREAEKQLTDFLQCANKGHVEMIMKDISTVRYHPENLWKWEKIAMRVAEKYAK